MCYYNSVYRSSLCVPQNCAITFQHNLNAQHITPKFYFPAKHRAVLQSLKFQDRVDPTRKSRQWARIKGQHKGNDRPHPTTPMGGWGVRPPGINFSGSAFSARVAE